VNSRLFAIWISLVCVGSAVAVGAFDARAFTSIALAMGEDRARTATLDPMSPLQSAEPSSSPTVTPLPPPPVPPPDAAGIAHTTPPLGIASPQPRPTVPNAIWLSASDSSTVAIALHGGRPFVPVVIDGVRRDFLLSSLRSSAIDDALHVDGDANGYFLRTVQIGDVRLTNVAVTRERLAPFSLAYLGAAAAGILGSELFARYPVTIDYPHRTMTVYRSEIAAASARTPDAIGVPMEMVKGEPAVSCGVDGISAAPCFVDVYSDADLWVWGPSRWTAKNQPAMAMRDAEPEGEMHGVTVRAHNLTIGTYSVSGPLLDIGGSRGEDEYAVESPHRSTLGSGIFSRFAITIDEPGGAFFLVGGPSAASTPSSFDGSGLWLVWRNGTVVVRSVVHRSPADAAGLAGGDVLLALDGKPLQNLDDARAALMGPSGTKVMLTYQRGATRRDVDLMLRSPL
jgi:PDZ domain-containing protein